MLNLSNPTSRQNHFSAHFLHYCFTCTQPIHFEEYLLCCEWPSLLYALLYTLIFSYSPLPLPEKFNLSEVTMVHLLDHGSFLPYNKEKKRGSPQFPGRALGRWEEQVKDHEMLRSNRWSWDQGLHSHSLCWSHREDGLTFCSMFQ